MPHACHDGDMKNIFLAENGLCMTELLKPKSLGLYFWLYSWAMGTVLDTNLVRGMQVEFVRKYVKYVLDTCY